MPIIGSHITPYLSDKCHPVCAYKVDTEYSVCRIACNVSPYGLLT